MRRIDSLLIDISENFVSNSRNLHMSDRRSGANYSLIRIFFPRYIFRISLARMKNEPDESQWSEKRIFFKYLTRVNSRFLSNVLKFIFCKEYIKYKSLVWILFFSFSINLLFIYTVSGKSE